MTPHLWPLLSLPELQDAARAEWTMRCQAALHDACAGCPCPCHDPQPSLLEVTP